jgi:hypothetical protein
VQNLARDGRSYPRSNPGPPRAKGRGRRQPGVPDAGGHAVAQRRQAIAPLGWSTTGASRRHPRQHHAEPCGCDHHTRQCGPRPEAAVSDRQHARDKRANTTHEQRSIASASTHHLTPFCNGTSGTKPPLAMLYHLAFPCHWVYRGTAPWNRIDAHLASITEPQAEIRVALIRAPGVRSLCAPTN